MGTGGYSWSEAGLWPLEPSPPARAQHPPWASGPICHFGGRVWHFKSRVVSAHPHRRVLIHTANTHMAAMSCSLPRGGQGGVLLTVLLCPEMRPGAYRQTLGPSCVGRGWGGTAHQDSWAEVT